MHEETISFIYLLIAAVVKIYIACEKEEYITQSK